MLGDTQHHRTFVSGLRQRLHESPALLASVSAIPIALLAGVLVFWLAPHDNPTSTADGPHTSSAPQTGPVSVAPVANASQTATACRAVLARLPNQLLGPARPVRIGGDAVGGTSDNHTERPPVAEYAAAWADPAVVLRCGVGRPAALTPSAELIGVNGVDWVADPGQKTTVWTTTSLPVNVELTVPDEYQDKTATQLLNPLAAPLRAALPPR